MDQPGVKFAPTSPVPDHASHLLRARYCECDPMGVVHHAAFIPWLEIGRTELLRSCGVSYAQLEAAGVFLVIVKLEVSYKRPAYYDDVLEIRTRVSGGSRIKIRHEYEVVRAADPQAPASAPGVGPGAGPGNNLAQSRDVGQVILTASSLLASVDRAGRPAPLPDWLVPTPSAPFAPSTPSAPDHRA
jgi:acyl-CoA thioester hydrolase